MPMQQYAMLLCVSLGMMGEVSPYGAGSSPVYYGSGYLPRRDFWRLGGVVGAIFFGVLLFVGVPWVLMTG